MSLEQNICVSHLLLKSSFVGKECKLLGSLITLGLDCGTANSLLGEYCLFY